MILELLIVVCCTGAGGLMLGYGIGFAVATSMRRRTAENNLALMTAERDGLGSQLLDVQQDSIAARKELRELKE